MPIVCTCRPPDYVTIAILMLLLAMPCALPALVWALKARSLHAQPDRLGEAWQYSHRAFFCCMLSIFCLIVILSSFSFTVFIRRCGGQCEDCTTTALPITVPPTKLAQPSRGNIGNMLQIIHNKEQIKIHHISDHFRPGEALPHNNNDTLPA